MSTIITVKNGAPPMSPVVVRVISQKIIDDGRELVPNGIDDIPAGESIDFVIHAGQSIRVVEEAAPVEFGQGLANETAPATDSAGAA